nr:hypothetical protein [Tanacetum cinerariifolium]
MSSNITAATFKQLMLFDYKFVLLGLEYMVNAAIMIMLLMLLEKDVIELVLLEYILNAIQALVDKKKVIITETSVKGDLHLEDVEGTECLPNATIFEQLTLMGAKTTAWNEISSTMASAIILFLDSQVEGMLKHKEIYVTPSHIKKIFVNRKRQGKDFSDEHVTTTSNDPLLSGLGGQEDASKQRRMIVDLDANERVALVDETQGRNDQDMFDTSILDDEEVVVEKEVSTADPVPTASEVVTTAGVEISTVGVEVSTAAITSQISIDEITLAEALIYIKTSKPKTKGIVMQEPSETPTPTPTPIDSSQQPSKAKDKGKPKMIKPEKPLKRKDQIMIDEEVARNLEAQMQAKFEEEERLMLFNNTMKWIESFVPMDTKLVKGSEKSAEGSEKAKEGSSKKAGGGRLMKAMYLNEVFGYILLIKTKLLIKKHKDSESEHQVLGRIVRIKRLHDDIRVTAAQKLRPLRDEDWKYAK